MKIALLRPLLRFVHAVLIGIMLVDSAFSRDPASTPLLDAPGPGYRQQRDPSTPQPVVHIKVPNIVVEAFAFEMTRIEAIEFMFKFDPPGDANYGLQQIEKMVEMGAAKKIAQLATVTEYGGGWTVVTPSATLFSQTLVNADEKWAYVGAQIEVGKTKLTAFIPVTLPGIGYFGSIPIASDSNRVMLVFALCHKEKH